MKTKRKQPTADSCTMCGRLASRRVRVRGVDVDRCFKCGWMDAYGKALSQMRAKGLILDDLYAAAPVLPRSAADFSVNLDFGALMTISEFSVAVDAGVFTNDDGFGKFATSARMSSQAVWPSLFKALVRARKIPSWATHVVWFNK